MSHDIFLDIVRMWVFNEVLARKQIGIFPKMFKRREVIIDYLK